LLDKFIDGTCRLFQFLMVVCLALMVVMVFGNVVLRYGFNSGLTVSEELSRWLFVWMTFLGSVVALRKHAHLGTDMLVSRLPAAGKKVCFALAHLLMLAMCWLMFKGSWDQTKINLGNSSAVMEASMAWLSASGLVFAVLAALIVLLELWKLATGQLAESELVAIVESEDVAPADVQQLAPAGVRERP
jgi:TRAP-type C4-dicarboxylate transport system permease small subunit